MNRPLPSRQGPVLVWSVCRALAGTLLVAWCHAGPAQAEDIAVASIAARTGPAGFAGGPEENGIRLAFDEANAGGALGADRIRLVAGDYASDKAQAINLANQAIQRDRVVLSLGPTASQDGIALGYVFNENKTPMISFATSNAITATGPWVFKIQQSGVDTLPLLARYAIDHTTVRKVALVFDPSNDATVEHKNVFRDTLKAGRTVDTTEEAVAPSEANFLPLVTKLVAMDPDGIFFSTYAEQTANIVVQLRQAGLPDTVRIFGAIGVVSPRLMAIGGKAVEGTLVVGEYAPGVDRPLNKAFESAYLARYKVVPDFFAAIGYSAGLVAVKAIKDAGPGAGREQVRNALANIGDVPVVVGNGTWSQKDRNGAYGAVMMTVKDGKFVPLP